MELSRPRCARSLERFGRRRCAWLPFGSLAALRFWFGRLRCAWLPCGSFASLTYGICDGWVLGFAGTSWAFRRNWFIFGGRMNDGGAWKGFPRGFVVGGGGLGGFPKGWTAFLVGIVGFSKTVGSGFGAEVGGDSPLTGAASYLKTNAEEESMGAEVGGDSPLTGATLEFKNPRRQHSQRPAGQASCAALPAPVQAGHTRLGAGTKTINIASRTTPPPQTNHFRRDAQLVPAKPRTQPITNAISKRSARTKRKRATRATEPKASQAKRRRREPKGQPSAARQPNRA